MADDNDKPTADKPPTADVALADRLAAQIAESNEKLVAAISARNDVPVADKDDYEQQLEAFRGKQRDAKKRAADLMAEGKFEEAIDAVGAIGVPPQPKAPDPAKDPFWAGMREDAVETVRSESEESKWLFDTYSDEVTAAIDALPVAQRVVKSALRRALAQVKAAHIDEVTDRRVSATIEQREREARETPPQNVPVPQLGETRDTNLHGLTLAERQNAATLGIKYEDYALHKKALSDQPFEGSGIPLA